MWLGTGDGSLAQARLACAAGAVVALTACSAATPSSGASSRGPAATSTPAATLPASDDLTALGALSIPSRPAPDFALAVGDLVWVSGVDPGIVGYDAVTGAVRASVPTQDVPLAMDQGFGSLWAGEGSGVVVGTLVRIDPRDGAVQARIQLPDPGLATESSLAVTEDAVWALLEGDADSRVLVAVDPATDTVRGTYPAPPAARAVRGAFGSLWVATGRRSVVRLDPADGTQQATIETGPGSRFMAVGPDAVWVLNQDDGTVSRIDPRTNGVVATVRVSDGRVPGGDITAGPDSVWVRTEKELATEVDPARNAVVRVLGPAAGSGGIALTDGAVWITAHDVHLVHRVPTG